MMQVSVREKPKGQLKMDNPETLAIWGTKDIVRRQTKYKKDEKHEPHQKLGVNQGTCER